MSDSLNSFLATAAKEGRIESGGTFTLAAAEARAKIRQFQLADPYLYVVHLVASAVSGGATKFRGYSAPRRVEFVFDGRRPTFEELHNIFDHLLGETGTVTRLQELGIALNGAIGTRPKTVVFQCFSDGDGVQMQLEGEEVVVSKLPQPPKPNARGNRLVIEYPLKMEWTSLFGGDRPERSVLRKFCWSAPLELNFDARRVSRFIPITAPPVAWRLIRAEEEAPGTEIRARKPTEEDGGLADEHHHPFPYSVLLQIEDSRRRAQRSGLVLICNGVRFHRPAEVLGFPLASAVVAAPGLKKNISHTDLVEDAFFKELLDRLKLLVRELLEDRADSGHLVPAETRPELREALQEYFPVGRRSPSIARWLKQLEFDERADEDQCRELLSEAEAAERAGLKEAADSLRTDVRNAMRRSVANATRVQKFAKAASLAARVEELNQQLEEPNDGVWACLQALAGEAVRVNDPADGPWEPERSVLRELCLGRRQSALDLLDGLPQTGWVLFLKAELTGELALYTTAAERIVTSGFLYHEAAAAHWQAEKYAESHQLRLRGYQNSSPTRPFFTHRIAREASGKLNFLVWVHWSVRSRLKAAEYTNVADYDQELSECADLPALLDEIESKIPLRSPRSEYLTHRAVWELRRRGQPQQALSLRARWMLRRMLKITKSGVRLIPGDRALS